MGFGTPELRPNDDDNELFSHITFIFACLSFDAFPDIHPTIRKSSLHDRSQYFFSEHALSISNLYDNVKGLILLKFTLFFICSPVYGTKHVTGNLTDHSITHYRRFQLTKA